MLMANVEMSSPSILRGGAKMETFEWFRENFAPGVKNAYESEMTNQRLDAVSRIAQLRSELRATIKNFTRVAESALAHSTYDVDMLTLHEQRIGSLQNQLDELIASLLPEDQRADFLRSPRRIRTTKD
jgi:hypothetical protein